MAYKKKNSKNKIIKAVAEKKGIPQEVVDDVFDGIFEEIKASILKEENVTIKSFGKFEPITREPRIYRNPKNGNLVPKDSTKHVSFKGTPDFKKLMNS